MTAPGLSVVTVERPEGSAGALRPDVAGFAGLFRRGPVAVAVQVEDWGEQRRRFGGFFPLGGGSQAFGPLALYAFFRNGGGTAVVTRLGSPKMRAATGIGLEPATGAPIRFGASSAGEWANGGVIYVPLVVRARRTLSAAQLSADAVFAEGVVVRVRDADGVVSFGSVARAGALLALPPTVNAARGPFAVDVLEDEVDVLVRAGGVDERHRRVSLRRGLASFFALPARVPPEEQPRVPAHWLQDPEVELALALQGRGVSEVVRVVAPAASGGTLGSKTRASLSTNLMVIELGGGADAIAEMGPAVIRSAIDILVAHPLPSIVSLPDLVLPLRPDDPQCEHEPTIQRFPEPPPPPSCACPPRAPKVICQPINFHPPKPPRPDGGDAGEAIAMPGWGSSVLDLQAELLRAIRDEPELGGDRIALLDSIPGRQADEVAADAAAISGGEESLGPLGTLLYPWVRVLDPGDLAARTLVTPASGHVAGLMAASARRKGPAARYANERMQGVVGVERPLDVAARGFLNDREVSVIHGVAGHGAMVYGARTLLDADRPDAWVPAARTLAFLRRALRIVGNTLVFEPNDELLRLRIRFAVGSLLRELDRGGAFAGASPDESYRIRCDDETNPPDEVALGRVVAHVDVALAVPLEFITVRIAFSRDGSSVFDDIVPPPQRRRLA